MWPSGPGPATAAAPSPARAQAQAQAAPVRYYDGPNSIYGAPGNYGVSWGVPSYGLKRTYSEFSSPYGAGYGYGYAPESGRRRGEA